MKFYYNLKTEAESIQQQNFEAKKKKRTNLLKEVKRLCKEFSFILLGYLKAH